jgi:hypothetical protein
MGANETPQYFNKYLEPVIMFNPRPFNRISEARPQWELETAIWAALDDGENSGKYAVTQDGSEILPTKDVTAYLKTYFGDSVKPTFKTFTEGNFTYQYDPKGECFYIPLIAVTNFYVPNVTKITHSFNTVTILVDYLPGQNWGGDSQADPQAKPVKSMEIVLKSSGGTYQIEALKENKLTSSSGAQAASRDSDSAQQ